VKNVFFGAIRVEMSVLGVVEWSGKVDTGEGVDAIQRGCNV
jgi:hypothetical protein